MCFGIVSGDGRAAGIRTRLPIGCCIDTGIRSTGDAGALRQTWEIGHRRAVWSGCRWSVPIRPRSAGISKFGRRRIPTIRVGVRTSTAVDQRRDTRVDGPIPHLLRRDRSARLDRRASQWLEPDERKPSCPVLRGGCGRKTASLPDRNCQRSDAAPCPGGLGDQSDAGSSAIPDADGAASTWR